MKKNDGLINQIKDGGSFSELTEEKLKNAIKEVFRFDKNNPPKVMASRFGAVEAFKFIAIDNDMELTDDEVLYIEAWLDSGIYTIDDEFKQAAYNIIRIIKNRTVIVDHENKTVNLE